MPCPHSRAKRAFSHLLVALPANLVQLCGREYGLPKPMVERALIEVYQTVVLDQQRWRDRS
jgi:hypothetical protein